ncbi:ring-1,2-phenylacetyl-CoA epoxidase subunit PaaE [Chitinophaga skermanii]|uniref:Ring-1,2-phenylacetyl-CoA epoxidase subunit PaaE n=1 Tax=Chitinophaga skermanii TaxID=331697 RepID=A0A327QQF2_9BACT|nr:ferredoxin--NADP reductase [Chitinophaga skermanii]RAJ04007.1 ring-1,2-phenylacetyl-CoA epoxidase subunit PaaE [Chitinophaga skermanii]
MAVLYLDMMNDLYIQLSVVDIVKETSDTYTYSFVAESGEPVPYKAGQFLTFVVNLHGVEYRRSYSLSSTPGIDEYLSVTVKRKENGEISRHILRHWDIGTIVTSLQPSGRFTLNTAIDLQRDIILLGAGSGITPLYSILKQTLFKESQSKVTLIYSNKNPNGTIFYAQLNALQTQYPDRFKIIYIFSEPDEQSTFSYRRISNSLLTTLAPQQIYYQAHNAQFYICGPVDYMRMCTFTLSFLGFSQEQIHKENFTIDTATHLEKIGVPPDTAEKTVHLTIHGQTHTLRIPGNKNILDVAQQQGLQLPYSCKGGVCGSCMAKCSEGKVWMAVNEVLTDKELAAGFVLTCVSYPVSDVVKIDW